MNKLIRGIPDDTFKILNEEAIIEGMDLNAYICRLLIQTAEKAKACGRYERPIRTLEHLVVSHEVCH